MSADKGKRGPAGAADRKNKAAKAAPAAPGPAAVVGFSLLALVAGFCLPLAVKAETPLGSAIPRLPKPIFEILPQERIEESSFKERRVAEAWLANLAPEPDGLPPLVQGYDSEGMFSIRHPYGAQMVAFPVDDVMNDGIISQAGLQFEVGLSTVKYSMPGRNAGESLAQYKERLRGELEAKEASFYDDADPPVAVDYYRFEQLRYRRMSEEEGEEVAHFLFIGPLGPTNVLVADFMARPADYDRAKALAAKIMNSFEPRSSLAGYAIAEFPELGTSDKAAKAP